MANPLRVFISGREITNSVENIHFANSDPGGFESCSLTLLRTMSLVVMPTDRIRIMDGTSIAWEGRVAEPQRSIRGRKAQLLISGEGYGAALKDNGMAMVYVDRDLTRWGAPSRARQVAMASQNRNQGNSQVGVDPTNALPALIFSFTGAWAAPYFPTVEALYDAGSGNLIAKVYYDVKLDANFGNTWSLTLTVVQNDDLTGSSSATSNLAGAQTATGYFTATSAQRFANWQYVQPTTPAGTQGQPFQATLRNLAVYGNHGLTGHGPHPQGFYPQDIATYAFNQARVPIGLGVIDSQTAFVCPHYVQYTPVPFEQHIADMAKLLGWHYGTWESLSIFDTTPRFDFRAPPSQPTCHLQLTDCDEIDISERLANYYDTAAITYQDAAGVTQLLTVTLDQPLLDQAGLHRTINLNLGISTAAAAAAFGNYALQLLRQQQKGAGSVILTRPVRQANGAPKPAHLLRAGLDRLRIIDLAPRAPLFDQTMQDSFHISRVETTVDQHGRASTRIEVDQGASLLETLQARLDIAKTIVGG